MLQNKRSNNNNIIQKTEVWVFFNTELISTPPTNVVIIIFLINLYFSYYNNLFMYTKPLLPTS